MVAEYPESWGKLAAPWDHLFRDNFELGMAQAWENDDNTVAPLLFDMGRYFSMFRLAGPDAGEYINLLRLLAERNIVEQTIFASLNYECLFERACQRLGYKLTTRGPGRPPGTLQLVKPHGSHDLVADQPNVHGITVSGGTWYYQGPVKHVPPRDLEKAYASGIPPVMSLFAAGKHSPVAPAFITLMRDEWAQKLREVSAVITIGVHPNPVDDHVWAPITAATKAEIWYVGGRQPGDPYEAVKEAAGDRFHHVADYFDEAIPILSSLLS